MFDEIENAKAGYYEQACKHVLDFQKGLITYTELAKTLSKLGKAEKEYVKSVKAYFKNK